MKIAAVIPAYNEERRIAGVLLAVKKVSEVSEIIVVNDASRDGTSAAACALGVHVLNLPVNRGKGGAMTAGAQATDADVILFLDADLIGLTPEHVARLLEPVASGRVPMAVGVFRGGRFLTDWSQKIVSCISGQRAIRRELFFTIPNVAESRYGVEMAITRHVWRNRIPMRWVFLRGVTHPMKEEKLGFWRGAHARSKMYAEMFRIVLGGRVPRPAINETEKEM